MAEAWARIAARAAALPAVPTGLSDAVGRILGDAVRSPVDLPGFDRSAMDGWAVRAADLAPAAPGAAVELPVHGESAAGSAGDEALPAGAAMAISTGAPLPPGADAVLPLERGTQSDGRLRTEAAIAPGLHVRRRGEDVRAGEVMVPAGARLTPGRLGAVASAGVGTVTVHPRPRVAVLVTGSELVPVGTPLPPGAIYNSNGPVLAAFARAAGADVTDLGMVADDAGATRAALEGGLQAADVLLVSGGVSVGPHDLVKPALAALGVEELFWRVRMRPGKPIFCGRAGARWVLGLPGNPLSAVVGFLVFGEPLLRRLAGDPHAAVRTLTATLAAPARAPDGRTTYATARLERGDDGELLASPTPGQGSHLTKALADADGFVIVPHERPSLAVGERAEVLPLPE